MFILCIHGIMHEIGSPEVVHAALELTTVLQPPGCCDYGHVPHYTSQEFLVQIWPCPHLPCPWVVL